MIEGIAKIPVILVLTKLLENKLKVFKHIEEMNLDIVAVHSVLAEPYVISKLYSTTFRVKRAIERTFNLIPENVRKFLRIL